MEAQDKLSALDSSRRGRRSVANNLEATTAGKLAADAQQHHWLTGNYLALILGRSTNHQTPVSHF